MTEARSVVIVEDDFLIAEYLRDLCEQAGYPVVGSAADAETALRVIRETRPSRILMDVRIKGRRDGVDVGAEVHKERPDVRIIYVTGSNEPPTIARIKTNAPYRILIKPIAPHALIEALG